MAFVTDPKLKRSPTYDGVYEHLVERYVSTIERLENTKLLRLIPLFVQNIR